VRGKGNDGIEVIEDSYFGRVQINFYSNAQILGQWPFWVYKITTVSLISMKAKNVKVGFFLLISYIRNTGQNI
jgi:hypothetical protein